MPPGSHRILSVVAPLFPSMLVGTHKAFRPIADQVGSSGFAKRLDNQSAVLWIAVLDECPLHGLFVRFSRAIDWFHRAWIKPRVVDACAHGRWGGVEILHLLGIVAHVSTELGKLDRFLERRPRMR